MKSTLLLCATLLAAFAADCRAQTPETLLHFDEGNRHYAAGEYQQAIAAYDMALDSGYASESVYYNLGNAYYRLDELGKAMLYYKRAEQLTPGRRELQHSIGLATSRLTDQFSRLPEPLWNTVGRRITTLGLTTPFVLIGLILYIIGMGLVGYRVWSGSENNWIRRAYSTALALAIPLLIVGIAVSYQSASEQSAVVMTEETSVLTAPSDDADLEIDIHEGLVVKVISSDTAWTEVMLPNGVTGWVVAETIQII